ncbi:MAG: transposase [Planctomycetota bacterium]|jgi:transposase
MSNYYLGCDVSKGYADFIILDSTKKIIEPVFQLDDTFEGHNQFYRFLQDFFKQYPGSTLFSAVESTGGLENNWLSLFKKLSDLMDIRSTRINPVGPNALHKASLERNSNDAISAKLIAEYLITYPEKVNYNADDPYVSLRKQWNLIEMYKKQMTQLLNQFNILLYTSMPFLMKYTRNGIPNWMLFLVNKYPSSSNLARVKETTLVKIPYISHKRACAIIAGAKQSVGSTDDDISGFVIKSAVEQILHLKNKIEQHKQYMTTRCDLPEVKLLESFQGIGKYSAIGLVLNIVSIDRFPSAKHLASYFGVHPVYKTSGDGTGGFHMSKKGRAAPRQILYMVARSSIIHNPLLKEVYINHLKRGNTKSSALGVCMHKILRIVFGMLKHQKEFDPEIDKQNRNKTRIIKKNGVGSHSKQRYQKKSEEAPVSRRQSIKRRKRKQSQNLLEV